jgi:hypothetical protein
MEYEESYRGIPILLTTTQVPAGGWSSEAVLLEGEQRVDVTGISEVVYESEEAARRAALSAAAGAIDRARASRGKP